MATSLGNLGARGHPDLLATGNYWQMGLGTLGDRRNPDLEAIGRWARQLYATSATGEIPTYWLLVDGLGNSRHLPLLKILDYRLLAAICQ